MTDNTFRVQFSDPNTIKCKDCVHRDRAVLTVGKTRVKVGVTRSTCAVFDGSAEMGKKPVGVTNRNENCKMYRKEE